MDITSILAILAASCLVAILDSIRRHQGRLFFATGTIPADTAVPDDSSNAKAIATPAAIADGTGTVVSLDAAVFVPPMSRVGVPALGLATLLPLPMPSPISAPQGCKTAQGFSCSFSMHQRKAE